jgi:phospholipid/cholesterol/gamma-HCH transport system substrate-binding protein
MWNAFRLGIFLVATLVILAIGSFLIGERQFLFASTYELKTTFKNVSGLNDGAEVRVGGIHKGLVKQIQLPRDPNSEVIVRLKLAKATSEVIREDSVASINTEGLLGNKYLAISFGSEASPKVRDGSTIRGVPPVDVSDMMKKTDAILATTSETMKHVEQSAADFKQISSKINRGAGTVGALVNDRKVYTELNEATTQAKRGAVAFQENMEALKHNFLIRGFFSGRGYDDSTKILRNAVVKLPDGTAQKKFTYDAKKLFPEIDKAKLKNERALVDAGRYLETHPFGTAVIVGVSGMKGDSEETLQLMQARAMVVRDYLVGTFRMDDTRVKTLGLPKGDHSTNDTGTMEIVVYPAAASASRDSRD